jgi:hypothetical protein
MGLRERKKQPDVSLHKALRNRVLDAHVRFWGVKRT